MKRSITILSVVITATAASIARADVPLFEVTPEIAKFVNGVVNESINANTLFASQEAIATGRYTQRQSNQPDKEYTTIRFPGEMALGNPSDPVRPVLIGNGALLRNTAGYDSPERVGESDFTVTSLFTLSGGVGALLKLTDSLTVAPLVSLSYSHVKNRYDFNNAYSQNYLSQVDEDLFNWDMDLFTYTPALKVYYSRDVGIGIVNYHIGYTYLLNDSFSDNSNVVDINSSTGLLTDRIDILTPLGVGIEGSPLFIRPMFQWNNISGSAVKGLGLRDLFEMGADLVVKMLDDSSLFSTITVGGSYVTGKSFEGYHIGLGVTF